MPRKKPAPKRLDDEEQRAANFVLGETENVEESAENLQINRALTESLTNASASEVQDILANVQKSSDGGPKDPCPSSSAPATSSIQLRASTIER